LGNTWASNAWAVEFELDDGSLPLTDRFASADVVATVKVESAMEQINLALSKQGRFVSEGVRYGVQVEDVWKGDLAITEDLLFFNVPLDACYKTLTPDTEYLLIATRKSNGELEFKSCDNFVLRSDVSQRIAITTD